MTEIAVQKGFDLSPQNFDQAITFAGYLAESDLVPKEFKGKPGNCLIAMQWGSELGMKPLQTMQNLAIINSRPCLWGDAVLALVLASPACEYVIETVEGDTAICKAKRKGAPEQVRTFSDADAKAAGLIGKQGPWTQYKARMRQMRARAFCLRDVFADVLRGMPVAEEAMDTPPERHLGEAVRVDAPTAPEFYPAEKFAVNLPQWKKVIETGRKTAKDIIAMAESKHPLTDEQKAAILAIKPVEDAKTSAPAVTCAVVAEKLHKATDLDALDTAADLIGSVADPEQRRDFAGTYVYETRKTAIAK